MQRQRLGRFQLLRLLQGFLGHFVSLTLFALLGIVLTNCKNVAKLLDSIARPQVTQIVELSFSAPELAARINGRRR